MTNVILFFRTHILAKFSSVLHSVIAKSQILYFCTSLADRLEFDLPLMNQHLTTTLLLEQYTMVSVIPRYHCLLKGVSGYKTLMTFPFRRISLIRA